MVMETTKTGPSFFKALEAAVQPLAISLKVIEHNTSALSPEAQLEASRAEKIKGDATKEQTGILKAIKSSFGKGKEGFVWSFLKNNWGKLLLAFTLFKMPLQTLMDGWEFLKKWMEKPIWDKLYDMALMFLAWKAVTGFMDFMGMLIGGGVVAALANPAFMAGMTEGLALAFAGTLGTALSFTGMALGLIKVIWDAVDGYFKAQEWGVPVEIGFLAGLIGGTGKGIINAFKGGLGWGAIGAGYGFAFGLPFGGISAVPAAIVGGIIGLALGGIMGFIGGEAIGKFLLSIPEKLGTLFDAIYEGFGLMIDDFKLVFWDQGFKLLFEDIGIGAKNFGIFIDELLTDFGKDWTAVTEYFGEMKKRASIGIDNLMKDFDKYLIQPLLDLSSAITKFIIKSIEAAKKPLNFILEKGRDFFGFGDDKPKTVPGTSAPETSAPGTTSPPTSTEDKGPGILQQTKDYWSAKWPFGGDKPPVTPVAHIGGAVTPLHNAVDVYQAKMGGVNWNKLGGRKFIEGTILDTWNRLNIPAGLRPTFTSGLRAKGHPLYRKGSKHSTGDAFDLRSKNLGRWGPAIWADLYGTNKEPGAFRRAGFWGQWEKEAVNEKGRTAEHFHFQKAAKGYSGIVGKNGPRGFIAGEAGEELVRIQPLVSPDAKMHAMNALNAENQNIQKQSSSPTIITTTNSSSSQRTGDLNTFSQKQAHSNKKLVTSSLSA